MFEFLLENDPNKPDFVQMTADDGDVREVCVGQGAEPLNDDEIVAIEKKQS